jgi:hypothetical protein
VSGVVGRAEWKGNCPWCGLVCRYVITGPGGCRFCLHCAQRVAEQAIESRVDRKYGKCNSCGWTKVEGSPPPMNEWNAWKGEMDRIIDVARTATDAQLIARGLNGPQVRALRDLLARRDNVRLIDVLRLNGFGRKTISKVFELETRGIRGIP